MRVQHVPVFSHIIATGGELIRPTVNSLNGGLKHVSWNTANPVLRSSHAIGAWDMDADASKQLLLAGLDYRQKMLSASLIIYDDGLGQTYFVGSCGPAAGPSFDVAIDSIDWNPFTSNLEITLSRRTGGGFDSILFDNVAINRGYVIIEYATTALT